MSCKCRLQFWWLCQGDFSVCCDGVNCAQVQEFQELFRDFFFFLTKELFRDEMQRNHAKNNLDRYTYYHQGWTNNEISRKKSGTYFGNFIVKDVLKHIVECRKIFSNGVMYMDTIFPRMKMLRLSFFFFFYHIQSKA